MAAPPSAPGLVLRRLLDGPGVLRAPGCYDPVSARLVEAAGFPAAYMSGAATSAVALGEPDLGFAGLSDMVGQAGRLAGALNIPLVADADTGYGNPLHVRRTVRAYEHAGVAAVHVEDQVAPKRCGHMAGKSLVPLAEMVAKVRAAVDARQHMLIIARTDARAVEGLAGAVERARAYRAAGADLLFLEGVTSAAELAEASDRVGAGLVLNCSEADPSMAERLPGDPGDPDDPTGLAALGVRLVIYPVATLLAAARAVRDTLAVIAADGHPARAARLGWDDINTLLGLPTAQRLEQRYADGDG